MLKQLLTLDRIRILPQTENWEAAIRLSAEPLLLAGAVTENYVEAMVQTVKEVGPYIVIDEGLAMPHARPEAGANAPGMALLILKSPVDFLGEPVQVLIALSAVDNNSHVEAMAELANLIWSGCDAEVLAGADTPEEAMALVDQYLNLKREESN